MLAGSWLAYRKTLRKVSSGKVASIVLAARAVERLGSLEVFIVRNRLNLVGKRVVKVRSSRIGLDVAP